MSDTNKLALSTDNPDEIDLGRIFGTLVDNKWLILSITIIFAILAIMYCVLVTPIYRSDALIQVEGTPESSILDNLNSVFPGGAAPTSDTETVLVQSRLVIGKTIKDLDLEDEIKRKYSPPIIGGWFAKLSKSNNDSVSIATFSVPDNYINQPFIIKVLDKNRYTLEKDGEILLYGNKDELVHSKGIVLNINNINASAGAQFVLTKRHFLNIYNELLGALTVADKGKNTGMLGLSYDNSDPEKATEVLNSISVNYVLQNVQRKTEVAEKSLEFIHEQMPIVKNSLTVAENKLNDFRQTNNSVDMSLQSKSLLDTIVQLDSELNELTFKETDISKLYTKDHPAYKALIEKKKILSDEKEQLNKSISGLPKTQQEIVTLTRDVEVGQQVFMQLLNKEQELQIAKASAVGNVRIIDQAMTRLAPISPKKAIIIILFTFLGFLVAIALCLVRKAFHRGIEGPAVLEALGMNVYASIPLSEWQKSHDEKLRLASQRHKNAKIEVLALGNPTDLAVEAIRSLRTSLHFAMMEAKNKALMISGVSPSIGKSFVSSNLAVVLAQTGKKVLLIDGDLRKGFIHQSFGNLSNKIGLSTILSGLAANGDGLQSIENVETLRILTRGQVPPNPSELLMGKRLAELLAWAETHFDIIVIDTPPILAVTDGAIIGSLCGTSLLVAKFEDNTVKQVQASLKRFEQNGIMIKGVILNVVMKRAASYYGNESYGYYEYDYQSKKDSDGKDL
ncbi:polysaccharide biosynthesis tyrosine autokinase [Sodalis sp. RH19]|uniref:polysaccharide biosynthesis tyrosine autokinase n=1 Tax=Sodalis sp. RH19 TaxID=3394334 RepID=UPI0039B42E62